MSNNIKHEMSIDEVEKELEKLYHIVDDVFLKSIVEAIKYIEECRGMDDQH